MNRQLSLHTFGLVLVCCLGLLAPAALADAGETYIKVKISDPAEVAKVGRLVSIDHGAGPDNWVAYANDAQLAALAAAGYGYEVLPHPGTLYEPRMAFTAKDAQDWDAYPTYSAYVQMMEDFATNYPSLTVLDTIGTSVQGRLLLMLKITDNPTIEEYEPEVLYTSTMHGDETAGWILTLRLIDSLLSTYGSDPRVTNIIDNVELYINPNANPDGTYFTGDNSVSGARRYNWNGVDLNRNFPDPQDGQNPDGNPWQSETLAFMNWADTKSLSLSANFHGGVEVVNYPWDTYSQRHADDDWFILISAEYADSCQQYSPSTYMNGFNDGITNGYDWYEVAGGRQDYHTYFLGGREVTIELSDQKLLSEPSLPAYWEYNRRSLLQYIEQSLYGIKGLVTDASTMQPVSAKITVLGHDEDSSRVFTDPDVGDYHRMIKSGTYTLVYSATGYYPDTVTGITVSDYSSTIVDVQLTALPNEPVLTFVAQDAGAVFAGDTSSFGVEVTNVGGGNATNVVGTLTCADTLVSILTASASYPTITALGGAAMPLTDFVVEYDPAMTEPTDVSYWLHLTGDNGYADSLQFALTVGQQLEDFETGDLSSFAWQNLGIGSWFAQSAAVYEGDYAVESPDITHGQSTSLAVTLDDLTEDSISFYVKVSSEANWDFLRFYIDDVLQKSWSGEVDWKPEVFPVTAGSHTFRWTYSKDGNTTNGADVGWVDYVVFPPGDGDKDNDGYANGVDNCPDDFNPDQADPDADGIGTVCDNCPDDFNPTQDPAACASCCVGLTGNVSNDPQDEVTLTDLTILVNHLFVTFEPLACPEEANTSGDPQGDLTLTDLTVLVNYLFVTFEDPAACQ